VGAGVRTRRGHGRGSAGYRLGAASAMVDAAMVAATLPQCRATIAGPPRRSTSLSEPPRDTRAGPSAGAATTHAAPQPPRVARLPSVLAVLSGLAPTHAATQTVRGLPLALLGDAAQIVAGPEG